MSHAPEMPFEEVIEQPDTSSEESAKKKPVRDRGWLLTLPAEYYTEEYVKRELANYSYVGQLERGKNKTEKHPEGYLHYQVYIENNNPIAFTTLKKKFPKGWFGVRRGTVKQAYEYCSKSDTRIGETFKNGEVAVFLEKSLKLADFIAMMVEGQTVSQIIAAHPSAVVHSRELEKLEAYRRRDIAIQGPRDIRVHYIWGQSGVGKTRGIYDAHGYEDVYRVSDYSHGFDNYDGQSVLVFDEYRGQLTLSAMLNLLDPYPVQLPARYSNKWASYTTVYMISNIPLEAQYPNVKEDEPESHFAFTQRFDTVREVTGINHRARIREEQLLAA